MLYRLFSFHVLISSTSVLLVVVPLKLHVGIMDQHTLALPCEAVNMIAGSDRLFLVTDFCIGWRPVNGTTTSVLIGDQ